MSSFIYFSISFALGSIVAFFSGIIAFFRNKKRPANRVWLHLNIITAIWSLGYLVMINAPSVEVAWWANWILHAAAIWIPSLYLKFILELTEQAKRFKKILYVSYGLSLFFFVLNPTKFFVQDVFPKFIFNYVCDAGPLYIYFTIHFFTAVVFGLLILSSAIRRKQKLVSRQLKYVFFSSLAGFLGGGSVFLITFNINFGPYLIILFALYPLIITYAIVRYRFMDVRAVVFRSFIFGSLIFVITLIYTLVTTFFGASLKYINVGDSSSNLVAGIVVGIFVVFGYLPMRRFLEKLTNKFLFKKQYESDRVIAKINSITASTLDLGTLLEKVFSTINEAMYPQNFAFGVLDRNKKIQIRFQQGFKKNEAEELAYGSEEIMHKEFSRVKEIIVLEELISRFEAGEYQPVSKELMYALYKADISLIVPLYTKENLIGIIAIGGKKSGDLYGQEDLSVLQIISGQVAIAIENAQLYDELKDFNKTLQQRIRTATKELRDANSRLREMDRLKSDFISIASHQLRTPLTVIKGYISMLEEGNFGKVSKKVKEQLGKVFRANERLIELVENLLDISRIEQGRQEYNFEKKRLEDVAEEVVENLSANAKSKGLSLTFDKPKKATPYVMVDRKLHEVMMNFVDNAIKYTPEGSVTVSVEPEPEGMVTFSVSDTGVGIDAETMPHLFRKFSRAEGSFQMHTEGLGLGLFVAKMIVDAHGGRIGAESKGKNKGSRFFFSLPVKKQKTPPQPHEPIRRVLK